MKICGFTFVKNAVKYGYPLKESLLSLLPLVDEMVICAGDSEDGTNDLIMSLDQSKIRLVHSVWDPQLKRGGAVLAAETNKALEAVPADADWLFYLQADEVIHEKEYPVIRAAMEKYLSNPQVEGLLFRYYHFYGSFRFIADGRKWYTHEIRVFKNDRSIHSYKDAQGFRKDGRKLRVKSIGAHIYHYGWVRNPVLMYEKVKDFGKLWNDDKEHDPFVKKVVAKKPQFDYSMIDSLSFFDGEHPAIMKEQADKENWDFDMDVKKKNFKNVKHRILYFIWKQTGWRPFSYRNYTRI